MAIPKAKTLQERFGFMDPDIKKPEHDEMIKWIDRNVEDILMLVFNGSWRPKNVKVKWETIVHKDEDGRNILGYVDLVVRLFEHRYLFEAKTEIKSLGELFRQVRMYQDGYIAGSPVCNMPIIIVSPDDFHAEKIREQGLRFLKYEPQHKFAMGGV
jgi:hypothetical protein